MISRYSEVVKPSEAPLYEIKANLFRALAHPVRIRVLELLVAGGADPETPGEVNVAELLADIGGSPSHLSGHLGVLRQYGVVTSRRVGSRVLYRTAHPAVVDLLNSARRFLLDTLAATGGQLEAAAALPPLVAPSR
jgi:ArsR family transcriptional regulator